MSLSKIVLVCGVLAGCLGAWAEDAPPPTPPAPPLAPAEFAKVNGLIQRLGAPDTVQREEAEKELMALGQAALPMLKEASGSANLEIAARAKRVAGRLANAGSRAKSLADILPADAVFFLEARDVQALQARWRATPL